MTSGTSSLQCITTMWSHPSKAAVLFQKLAEPSPLHVDTNSRWTSIASMQQICRALCQTAVWSQKPSLAGLHQRSATYTWQEWLSNHQASHDDTSIPWMLMKTTHQDAHVNRRCVTCFSSY